MYLPLLLLLVGALLHLQWGTDLPWYDDEHMNTIPYYPVTYLNLMISLLGADWLPLQQQ